jgi:hypothetical protein
MITLLFGASRPFSYLEIVIFETIFPMAEHSSSIESPFMIRAFLSLAEKMERFAIVSPLFTNIYLFIDFVN